MSNNTHCEAKKHHHHHHHCPVLVGDSVEAFDIESYNPVSREFENISLEELRKAGKWVVLFFYPADFTFVCPTELADLADYHEELKDLGVEIIAMSTDKVFSHLAWRDSEKLIENVNYQMGADPLGKISRMFGVFDCSSGVARRGTFIINPDGMLVGSEVSFDNVGRSASELVRKIKALLYLRENPNQACPAKWVAGETTLTPSEKIVGKVYEEMNK